VFGIGHAVRGNSRYLVQIMQQEGLKVRSRFRGRCRFRARASSLPANYSFSLSVE
jgi:hypothetical protein